MIRLLLETHTYRESFLENITFRKKEEKIIINMNYLMSNNTVNIDEFNHYRNIQL